MRKVVSSIVFLAALFLQAADAYACPDRDGILDFNCDGTVKVVCFGDSITFGTSDAQGLGYPGRLRLLAPNIVVVNLGDPGEMTPTGLLRAQGDFRQHSDADFFIILEGVNDFFLDDRSVADTRNNVLAMVNLADSLGAISLLGNLVAIRRNNQRSWVSAVNDALAPFRDIDFFSLGEGILSGDLIHPDGNGYQRMAELVLQSLRTQSNINRPPDSDLDGIYDFAEAKFNSDPFNPDTDGDTLLDGAEVFTHGSSPAVVDTDLDAVDDATEVNVLGSDPGNPLPGAPTLTAIQPLN